MSDAGFFNCKHFGRRGIVLFFLSLDKNSSISYSPDQKHNPSITKPSFFFVCPSFLSFFFLVYVSIKKKKVFLCFVINTWVFKLCSALLSFWRSINSQWNIKNYQVKVWGRVLDMVLAIKINQWSGLMLLCCLLFVCVSCWEFFCFFVHMFFFFKACYYL